MDYDPRLGPLGICLDRLVLLEKHTVIDFFSSFYFIFCFKLKVNFSLRFMQLQNQNVWRYALLYRSDYNQSIL